MLIGSTRSAEDYRWRPARPVSMRANPHAADAGNLPLVIVILAVLFNAVLSIVNAHLMPLSPNAVIGVEVILVLAAHAVVIRHFRDQMAPWYAMIFVIVLFSLARGVVTGSFDPKFARDALLIPTFVLLGMTVSQSRLPTLVIWLQAIVLGFLFFEAAFTDAYASLFDIRGYYVATRGLEESSFYAGSDLFVNSMRPGERFFSFIDLHRMSSVLLEPVSLGNYVVIITAFVSAFYRQLSGRATAFLIVSNIILVIGCDGRLAAVSSVIVILVALAAPYLPRKSAVLYLPLAMLAAVGLIVALNPPLDDNFQGRIAITVDLLSRYDLVEWLGLSNEMLGKAVDSGIAYTVATQSAVGLFAFWTFLTFGANERTLEQVKFLHCLCVYLALTMLVSYSLFSIKTGALLWFIYGALQFGMRTRGATLRAAEARRAIGYMPFRPSSAWP